MKMFQHIKENRQKLPSQEVVGKSDILEGFDKVKRDEWKYHPKLGLNFKQYPCRLEFEDGVVYSKNEVVKIKSVTTTDTELKLIHLLKREFGGKIKN